MQLVINTYGASLRKKDDNFLVSVDDKKSEVSPKKVSSILISTSAVITTDALHLAIENNIEVVMLDYSGQPFARVWHCRPGSTNRIRRLQLYLDRIPLGLEMAKEWLSEKITGRIEILKQMKKRRKVQEELFDSVITELEEAESRIGLIKGTPGARRGEIMGLEGCCGRNYFAVLSQVLPSKFRFNGRSKNPAKDPFNAMLNYAYGVLYSKVESACIIAGLDPYVGILHTDNYNKLSLVYDIIEMFRPWAEETVIFLFTGRRVDDDFFRESKGGVFLDKPGKQVLIAALGEMFEKTERFQKRNIKRLNIIQFRCHQIANQILKEVKYDAGMGDLRHNEKQTEEPCCEDLQTDGVIPGAEISLSWDAGDGGN